MPRTLPTRNGRELPARSGFRQAERPPFADPRIPEPPDPTEPLRRRICHRLVYICAAMAALCAVAWGATGDTGYLVLAVLSTGCTMVAVLAAE